MAKKGKSEIVQYWTWSHNVKDSLENGSFIRGTSKGIDGPTRLAMYTNGDYMGEVLSVPPKMIEVSRLDAEAIIPGCCGGRGGRA